MLLEPLSGPGLAPGALTMRNESALAGALNFVSLPLILLSGLLLPLALAPGWLKAIAAGNPLYYAVEACRQLMSGAFGGATVALGFGVFGILAIVASMWTVPKFRRVAA